MEMFMYPMMFVKNNGELILHFKFVFAFR